MQEDNAKIFYINNFVKACLLFLKISPALPPSRPRFWLDQGGFFH